MSFEPATDDILGALRTTIGASTVIGEEPDTVTVTWRRKLEGPPLRWIEELGTGYPMIVLEPGDTGMGEENPGPNLISLSLPVTVHAVVPTSVLVGSAAAVTAYRVLRLIGEKLVGTIMDAGDGMGTDYIQDHRVPMFGINYPLTEEQFEKKLGVYSFQCEFLYYEMRPKT